MSMLSHLFKNNRKWAASIKATDPDFFKKLTKQQSPEYLWIGCSDSRVPANQIVGLMPGQVFVHRNVANVVAHSDLNCLSVIQFAVDVLKVQHIIVCGHYGCGGIEAALKNRKLGLINNWLRHVQDVMEQHVKLFKPKNKKKHWDMLCELNVIEQVESVIESTIVQEAWARGQNLTVHGWIYDLHDGLLRDLGVSADNRKLAGKNYKAALKKFN
jgi:carbonic anhydrase